MENRKELEKKYQNPILTLNVDDKVLFTEDGWNTSYKGKIVSIHNIVGYYRSYGRNYGYADCSPHQVKLISK